MNLCHKPRPAFPQVRRADAPALEHTARQGSRRRIPRSRCGVGCGAHSLPAAVETTVHAGGAAAGTSSRQLPPSQRRRPGARETRPGRSRPRPFATICVPAGTHTPTSPPGAVVMQKSAAAAPGIHRSLP